ATRSPAARPDSNVCTTPATRTPRRSGSCGRGCARAIAASSPSSTPSPPPRNENAEKERLVRARLRDLDRSVLDIEHSLTALGHDDAAEALVRAETMRERGRGLRALLAEKQRGLERELTAAADEGGIETPAPDAAALRRELAEVDDESSALEPKLAEVEAAEQDLAAERAART